LATGAMAREGAGKVEFPWACEAHSSWS